MDIHYTNTTFKSIRVTYPLERIVDLPVKLDFLGILLGDDGMLSAAVVFTLSVADWNTSSVGGERLDD